MTYKIFLTNENKEIYDDIKSLLNERIENFQNTNSATLIMMLKIIKSLSKKEIKSLISDCSIEELNNSKQGEIPVNFYNSKSSIIRHREAKVKEEYAIVKNKLIDTLVLKGYGGVIYTSIFKIVHRYLLTVDNKELKYLHETDINDIENVLFKKSSHVEISDSYSEISLDDKKNVSKDESCCESYNKHDNVEVEQPINNINKKDFKHLKFIEDRVELLKVFVEPHLHETFEKFVKEIDKEINNYIQNL